MVSLKHNVLDTSTNLSYALISGITDDDLRETAYEILVAAAGAAGYAFILDHHMHIFSSLY